MGVVAVVGGEEYVEWQEAEEGWTKWAAAYLSSAAGRVAASDQPGAKLGRGSLKNIKCASAKINRSESAHFCQREFCRRCRLEINSLALVRTGHFRTPNASRDRRRNTNLTLTLDPGPYSI